MVERQIESMLLALHNIARAVGSVAAILAVYVLIYLFKD